MRQSVKNIIAKIYDSDDFKIFIKNINPSNFRDDLRQDIAIIMLGMEEGRVMDIYNSGNLHAYMRRVAMYACKSNHRVNKIYNTPALDLCLLSTSNVLYLNDYNYSEIKDNANSISTMELSAISAVNGLTWYQKGLIDLYIKCGSYREVEKYIKSEIGQGIPLTTTYATIRKALNKVKDASLGTVSYKQVPIKKREEATRGNCNT